MGKQKHDIGLRKRQYRRQKPSVIDGAALAQSLIERGLAHRGITDKRFTPDRGDSNPSDPTQTD